MGNEKTAVIIRKLSAKRPLFVLLLFKVEFINIEWLFGKKFCATVVLRIRIITKGIKNGCNCI